MDIEINAEHTYHVNIYGNDGVTVVDGTQFRSRSTDPMVLQARAKVLVTTHPSYAAWYAASADGYVDYGYEHDGTFHDTKEMVRLGN